MWTRYATYTQHNIVMHLHNHCCHWKAVISPSIGALQVAVHNIIWNTLPCKCNSESSLYGWATTPMLCLWLIYVSSNNKTTYLGLHVKCPKFLSHFNQILTFFTDCNNGIPISNFIKMCPVETDLIRADGQMDKMKPIGTFCEYVNVPQKINTIS